MKSNFIKALCVAASITLAFTGCSNDNAADSQSDNEKFTLPSWSSTTEKTTATSDEVESKPELTPRDFGDSGSIISRSDGQLEVARRSRADEMPMGDDDWTILVYMCGTDLESLGFSASTDIFEAFNAELGENINFVFQTGGTNEWSYSEIAADKIQRFELTEDYFNLVDEQSLTSMGRSSTLSDFIEWGVENYPADNMGLIFWNHGGGSISGVCFDERFDYDSLTLDEIDKALSNNFDNMTEKFEFIGFDACLMATLETANMLVPYANYMFASEELEPSNGWDYTAMLDFLAKSPDADGAALGKAIGEAYYEHCKLDAFEYTATLSVTKLSEIDALITSFDKTAQQMYESGKFTDIVKAIQSADSFGGNNRTEGFTNMVDLGGILEAASDYCSNADDTLDKLKSAIRYKKNGIQHGRASGLSIYYPLAVQGSEELSTFSGICPSSYYLAFVDKVAYGTTGGDISTYDNAQLCEDYDNIWDIDYEYGDYSTNTDGFADYETGSIPVEDIFFNDDGYYTVKLTDFDNLSYAACSLFLEDTDGTSIYLGCDDEVVYDWTRHLITDDFDGTWLSLGDGQPLPIEIVDKTDDVSIYTCTILLNGEYTNLRLEYDWNHAEWNVLGTWDGIDEDTGMASRDIVQLEIGDVIEPVYSYLNYDTTDYFTGDPYKYNGSLGLSYEMLPAADYTYSITLYDIYGNWYFTPEVTFTIEDDGSLTFYPDELDDDYSGNDDDYNYYDDYDNIYTCDSCYGSGCDYCEGYGYFYCYICEECNGDGCDYCEYYGYNLYYAGD